MPNRDSRGRFISGSGGGGGGGISAGDAVWTIGGDLGPLDQALDQAESKVSQVANTFEISWAKVGLAVGAAGAAITGALGFSVKAFADSEAASTQMDAVLRSTGGAAGMTKDALVALADEMQKTTAFEDDAVIEGENLLLTFTGIGKEIFPQATKAMLDMSQALGQDLSASAIQLGKSLNDPIQGMTALKRVGVSFTEEQIAQVKAMQEAGDVMGAQKLILAELNKEFGGSAVAAADTLTGKWEQLKNEFGNLMEDIGKSLSDNGLRGLMDSIKQIVINVDQWVQKNPELAKTLAIVAAAIGGIMVAAAPLLMVMPGIIALFGVLSGVGVAGFGAVAAALAGLGVAGYAAYSAISGASQESTEKQKGGIVELATMMQAWYEAAETSDTAAKAKLADWTPVRTGLFQYSDDTIKSFDGHTARIVQRDSEFKQALADHRVVEVAAEEASNIVGGTWADRFEDVKRRYAEAQAAMDWQGPVQAASVAGEQISAALAPVTETTWSIMTAIENVAELMGWAFSHPVEVIEGAFRDMGIVVMEVINGISSALQSLYYGLIQPVLNSFTKGFFGGSQEFADYMFPGRASGGPVTGGMPYIVGEHGPELFVPGSSGTIVPNGAGANVTINMGGVNVRNDSDIRRLSEALAASVSRELRGLGAHA